MQKRLGQGHSNRQMLDGPHARAFAPLDPRFVDSQLKFRPALEQGLQRANSLDARELMAEAEVNAGAEGNMPVRLALEIELLRVRIGPRMFAATSMAMIFSPFLSRTPPSSMPLRM
jgi:hypothetical protein